VPADEPEGDAESLLPASEVDEDLDRSASLRQREARWASISFWKSARKSWSDISKVQLLPDCPR